MRGLINISKYGGTVLSRRLGACAFNINAFKPQFQSLRFQTTDSSPIFSLERNTAKPVLSRKTFLVDYYKYLNDSNEIVLFVHHNNLVKAENKKFRADLRKIGANLNIIRNSIYDVYLKSEHENDPADAEVSKRNKDRTHSLSPLLNGPTGIITIPKCDPPTVAKVLKVLNSAQEKLILIGARVEQKVLDARQVDAFKDLPSKEELHAQLVGSLTVLGGAGLVRTLEASSNVLYLTLEERRKDMDPNEKSNEEN
ncbi:Piso0_000322 [Millerozyma farinosa CBS 7064]|uniref:Piso0_000322 protein n=1 Tax=Pichia sorbitophila (strain ATCC MYA-4447 / BCRC 22081 / CBS 7064 / NBRC 10061 / NRRL Y-12695) TaxID=559304 RepID=G8YTN8_PICSO|nr:Piso0_000322 [Millerozyma farinosa CBS 7064]